MFNDPKTDRFTPETVDEQIEQPANQQLAGALRLMHKAAPQEEDRASLLRVQQQLRQRVMSDAAEKRPGKLYLLSPRAAQRRPRGNQRVSPVLASLVALLLLGILVGMFTILAHTSLVSTVPKTAAPVQNNFYTLSNNTLTKLAGQNGATIWQQAVPHQLRTDFTPYSHLEVHAGIVYAIFDYDMYALHAGDGHIIWHTHAFTSAPTYTVIDGASIYIRHDDGTIAAYSTSYGARQWYNTSFNTVVVHPIVMVFQVLHGLVYIHFERNQQVYLDALDSATGNVRWSRSFPLATPGPPTGFSMKTLSVNGTVYYLADKYLYALNEQTGQILWRQPSPESALFSQLYLVDGVVYTVTGNDAENGSRVYAFAASNGKPLWVSSAGYGLLTEDGDVTDSTLLSQHGYVFVNSNVKNGHTIQALNSKDGKVAWQLDLPVSTSYVSGRIANHTLYVNNESSGGIDPPLQLTSIDLQMGKLLASHKLTFSYQSLSVLGSDAHYLYLSMASEGIDSTQAIARVRLVDSSILWQKRLTPPSNSTYEVTMAP